MKSIVFFDTEIGVETHKILDIGAVRDDGSVFHSASVGDFRAFAAGCEYVCGHNIVNHDLKYLLPFGAIPSAAQPIDTLYLSPLLFPKRPYHALLKDDKIQSDELNNPVNDSKKAQDLFNDEVNAFARLPETRQQIFFALLGRREEFRGFFQYIGFAHPPPDLPALIQAEFVEKICAHAEIASLILDHPVELAYALALIGADDHYSVTPPWLLRTSPGICNTLKVLRNTPCREGCAYCRSKLDIHKALREHFGFFEFRAYNGEPLQERATQAAVDGKSITFQLPALMAGRAAHGLTVVISPLQSLMKDQVDNLNDRGIVDAVTVNGLFTPIERKEAYDRVESGMASLLYISPELLRSRTLENMLLSRNIVRFVIDGAQCREVCG